MAKEGVGKGLQQWAWCCSRMEVQQPRRHRKWSERSRLGGQSWRQWLSVVRRAAWHIVRRKLLSAVKPGCDEGPRVCADEQPNNGGQSATKWQPWGPHLTRQAAVGCDAVQRRSESPEGQRRRGKSRGICCGSCVQWCERVCMYVCGMMCAVVWATREGVEKGCPAGDGMAHHLASSLPASLPSPAQTAQPACLPRRVVSPGPFRLPPRFCADRARAWEGMSGTLPTHIYIISIRRQLRLG